MPICGLPTVNTTHLVLPLGKLSSHFSGGPAASDPRPQIPLKQAGGIRSPGEKHRHLCSQLICSIRRVETSAVSADCRREQRLGLAVFGTSHHVRSGLSSTGHAEHTYLDGQLSHDRLSPPLCALPVDFLHVSWARCEGKPRFVCVPSDGTLRRPGSAPRGVLRRDETSDGLDSVVLWHLEGNDDPGQSGTILRSEALPETWLPVSLASESTATVLVVQERPLVESLVVQ
ncbi:hypothetical protein H920_16391 [Fukomys damarensis]|uniref:Uncharacterized protein n=1 Tax=Fukomys damarensis TaxID=885580 RepID=A0A091CUS6_FUKDA|nr:hypothetical protein H920_16391 [Fukomys damarensis]